ncbi:class I SAM-dependent methyltransferase [Paenibacillus eucommiae]|uniref:Ubiquinone/menaquinone biosynthesis C-methylase UbiE n=1 Tax=Paenibacillus eucommiae TaxID=1355755 RepID=A0ABS4IU82_9BACL|nr:class I SAM-dependent methyltransferase [Paenibacillus eucommiae]MBP1991140.1 ubiquinone/menaquinone biosynthesis C-methylase UbiE [Paenibacillus eucommiae]
MNKDIIKANIEVHTIMAASYNQEPHFKPENRQKVKEKLIELREASGPKLLDVGCGTGFIIDLAKDLFDEIHGIDVTQAMLDQVDISNGNITLYNSPAETLPFNDDSFDMATAYSFIHHVHDYTLVLKEIFRVLKPGAIFYVDLEPNKLFWQAMSNIENNINKEKYSDIVLKEINSVLHTDENVQAQFGIEKEVFNQAEYIKNILGGIEPYIFRQDSLEIGFSKCEIDFQWFLGQGTVMHRQSFEDSEVINNYLKEIRPLSNHLFKYLRFILVK